MTLIQIDRTIVDTKDIVTLSVPSFEYWDSPVWYSKNISLRVGFSNGSRLDVFIDLIEQFKASSSTDDSRKQEIKKAIEKYIAQIGAAVWRNPPIIIALEDTYQ